MKTLYVLRAGLLLSMLLLVKAHELTAQSTVNFMIDATPADILVRSVQALPNGESAVFTSDADNMHLVVTVYDKNGTIVRSFDYTSQIVFPNVNRNNTEFNYFTTSTGNIFITYNCSDSYQMLSRSVKYLVYSASGTLLNSGTVNTTDPGITQSRFVTMAQLSNGNVVISWSRSDNSSYAFRIYTATGIAVTGADNTYVGSGSPNTLGGNSLYTTMIAASPASGFMATFYYYNGNFSALRFDNNGVAQQTNGANTFAIDPVYNNNYTNWSILGLANGNYLVVWARDNLSYYKIVSPAGADVKATAALGIDYISDVKLLNTPGDQGFLIAELAYRTPNDYTDPLNHLRVHKYGLDGIKQAATDLYSDNIGYSVQLFTGNPQGYGYINNYYKTYTVYNDPDPQWSYAYGTGDLDVKAGLIGFPATTLPVRMLEFNASVVNTGSVNLSWRTTEEKNNDHFTIERSPDGWNYKTIATVKAMDAGTLENRYEFEDANPLKGAGYYRLVQFDKDGKYTYSSVRRVQLSIRNMVSVYPNPVSGTSITVARQTEEPIAYTLINAAGITIRKGLLQAQKQTVNVKALTKGTYWLRLSDGKVVPVVKN